MAKILVFGNSGSGKSTLARNLVASRQLAHLELDTLAWLPVSPPKRKPIEESRSAISRFTASNDSWVIEGCYADLMALLLDQADEMIFLNLAIEDCVTNANNRPFEPHKFSSPEAQEQNQAPLLQWIRDYNCREDECSFKAHKALFEEFQGRKSEYTSLSQLRLVIN